MSFRPIVRCDTNEFMDKRNVNLRSMMKNYFGASNLVQQKIDTDFEVPGPDIDAGEWIPIERKVVPSDLLGSLQDGRLAKQCNILATRNGFLLLEGHLTYEFDGRVHDANAHRNHQTRNYSRKQVLGLLASIQDGGVKILWSNHVSETPDVIMEAYTYSQHTSGTSFMDKRKRGKSLWGGALLRRDEILYAFQGFGLGPKLAELAWKHSKTLGAFLEMGPDERENIEKFGVGRSKKVEEYLNEEWKAK